MDSRYMLRYWGLDTRVIQAIKKQEAWRQKQIDIYYRNGRPLYKVDKKIIS